MSFRKRPKRSLRAVHVLKNPDPKFVSIVDHGANQTPFNTLKREGEPHKMTKKTKKGKLPIRKKPTASVQQKAASKAAGVRKLVFSGEKFATRKEVKAWLEENDWENFNIKKVRKGFEAASPDASDSDFKSLREVEVTKGILGLVGEIIDPVDPEEDEDGKDGQDAQNVDEDSIALKGEDNSSFLAKKFDWWGAFLSGEDSTSEVLRDAMSDGTPPGFDEIIFANTIAMKNILKGDGTLDEMVESASEMAEIIFKVNEVFSVILDDKEATDEEKSAAKAFKDAMVDEEAKATKADAGDAGTDDGDGGNLQTIAKNLAAIAESAASTAKSMVKLDTKVDELGKTVDDVQKGIEEAKELASSASDGVKKLENKVPVSKADGDDFRDEDDPVVDESVAAMKIQTFGDMIGLGR